MLVIALRLDEKVLIDDNIDIQVSSIQKGIIRLAINAPKDIRIQRVPKPKKNVEDEMEWIVDEA